MNARIWLWYDHPGRGFKNGRTLVGYDLREFPVLIWDAFRLWRAGLRPSVQFVRPGR